MEYIKKGNEHIFEFSVIRGEVLESEREREIKRNKEIVFGYYTRVTYYP